MSGYGENILRKWVPAFVEAGLTIVSGLAYGIDAKAHQEALEREGGCIAVLAHGLDRVYPVAHTRLARAIVENGGCLLSEYAAGVPPQTFSFPRRNRIIAALAEVVLIVEAGEKSGTMHTARWALEIGHTVVVVPGDIFQEQSWGANRLIKEGAEPVTRPEDVLQHYQIPLPIITEKLRPGLTGTLSIVYEAIVHGGNTVDTIAALTQLPIQHILSSLSVLEIDGYLQRVDGLWRLA
jgi:DNA processing protein